MCLLMLFRLSNASTPEDGRHVRKHASSLNQPQPKLYYWDTGMPNPMHVGPLHDRALCCSSRTVVPTAGGPFLTRHAAERTTGQ